ncbi:translation initiation factor IF-2 [candidate division KSB1 bacterium]
MSKKIRIFKLAKELNIASEELISFLRDADYEVRNINTPVDEDMYASVMEKFSAEKTLADKKSEKRRKRKIDRGELTGVEESDEDANEKKSETERPAILEALDTLKKKEAEHALEDKEVKEEKSKKKKVKPVETEAAQDEDVKPEKAAGKKASKKEEKIETVPVEETIEPKKKEAAEEEAAVVDVPDVQADAEEIKDIPKKKKSGKQKDEDLVEPGLEKIEEPKAEERELEVGQKIKTIDLSGFDVSKKRKSKKEKEREKEAKKEKEAEAKKEKEAEAKKEKESRRKLSKKGKGVLEKVREQKKDEVVADTDDKETSKKKKKRKRSRRKKIDEQEIAASIKETMAKMEETSKSKKYKKRSKISDESEEEEIRLLKVPEFASISELANMMDVQTNDLISKCMELGLIVTINQRLDMDTIQLVADEFDFEVQEIDVFGEEEAVHEEDDDPKDLKDRSPVVTIMGHVDHGKTSLLDYIRNANVVAGEKGGITQHIGAYEVELQEKKITFLDTPGHEAFTAMRARGAQITDIVVLIVAADDSVMPQTLEALNHAQAAGVPIIIAINKIDKPAANPEKIRQQLSEHKVLVESWGGKYPDVEISAKSGVGIEDLLDTILIQAEILELMANPDKLAKGVVIEARQEKGKGTVCTILVQTGSLRHGDFFVCGQYYGRVKALYNERSKKVKAALPATPVQVLGFSGTPQAGDIFIATETDKAAKAISQKRKLVKREQDFRKTAAKSLYDISEQIKVGGIKELLIILKADTDGSLEALEDSFLKMKHEEVDVKIIHKSVGGITEADVLLAASGAVIIGFHIRPNLAARQLAEKENVDIKLYDVIYDAIADVKAALEGMLEPDISEEVVATVEVRETFRVPKIGVIAGCYVLSGNVERNSKVRLVREGIVIFNGTVNSLKRFKEDAKEVASGFECGIGIDNYNDIKVGDIFETYRLVEEKRVLS